MSFQTVFYIVIGTSTLLILATPLLYCWRLHPESLRKKWASAKLPSKSVDFGDFTGLIDFAQKNIEEVELEAESVVSIDTLFRFVANVKLILNFFIYEDLIVFLIFNLMLKKYRKGLNSIRNFVKTGNNNNC